MHGYRDRVRQHRRRLAELANGGERLAIPYLDGIVAPAEADESSNAPREHPSPTREEREPRPAASHTG
jgi:hypothetical protein